MATDEGVQYETPIRRMPPKCYGCDAPHGVGEGMTSFVEPDPSEIHIRYDFDHACKCVRCGTVNFVDSAETTGRWA